jgi:peptidoglycan/LPS O-acetylase OafA/YrhL
LSVAAEQAGRDRVLDAVKAVALLIVVVAHCLGWYAWDLSTGTSLSVLDVRPGVWWITWLQVLPLFFAAGAVANLSSWNRHPKAPEFWQRRMLRLGTPALIYAAVGTAIVLPIALAVPAAESIGRFLPYHLWFLAFYGAIVLAVPWTSRWADRPVVPLLAWLGVVVVVDALRWRVGAGFGLVNFLLVWGWIHQVGYCLPRLRTLPRLPVALAGLAALGLAATAAGLGPYSRALVSFGGDPEMSNLAPPTLVLALFGLGQVLLLAAAWPSLERWLAHERAWLVVGAVGARAIGIYLWHLPVMAVLAGVLMALDVPAEPFGPSWWLVHLGVLVLALAAAWVLAGYAGLAAAWLQARVLQRPRRRVPVLAAAIGVPVATLLVAFTGIGTWWGSAMGLPSSSVLAVTLLGLAWWTVGVADTRSGVGPDEADAVGVVDLAEPPGGDTAGVEEIQGRADLALGQYDRHPDAHVEGAVHLGLGDAEADQQPEHG